MLTSRTAVRPARDTFGTYLDVSISRLSMSAKNATPCRPASKPRWCAAFLTLIALSALCITIRIHQVSQAVHETHSSTITATADFHSISSHTPSLTARISSFPIFAISHQSDEAEFPYVVHVRSVWERTPIRYRPPPAYSC